MNKKPSWAIKAYKGTKVNWAKTQARIYKMLGESGIYEIRFTNLKDKFILEFLVRLEEGQKPRAVRIIVPVHLTEDKREREKELNIIHHKDSSKKLFAVNTRTLEKILKEIKKCELLCANCHFIKENKEY